METPIDNVSSNGWQSGAGIFAAANEGLLLLTAHRAKGLEFDHVAVLDGGWDRVGRNEDADAPRRLYYVAMTRAREDARNSYAWTNRAPSMTSCRGMPQRLGALRRSFLRVPRCDPLPTRQTTFKMSTWALPDAYKSPIRLKAPSTRCRLVLR